MEQTDAEGTSHQEVAAGPAPTSGGAAATRGSAREWALRLGVIGLLLALYAPTMAWMVSNWAHYEYYQHGFLVPVVSGYLIWRKRDELAASPVGGHVSGLAVLFFGILVHAAGTLSNVHFLSAGSLVIVLVGLVLYLWGWAVFRQLAFPLCFLGFMVPLGVALVDLFTNPLQRLATVAAGEALRLGRIPVHLEGTSLQVPGYLFEVGVPCSGLKAVITLSALAALAAYLLAGPVWKRLLVFAGAVPVALAANAARVAAICLIGKSLGERAAESFLHELSGLMVFLLGLVGLLALGALLGCDEMRDDI